MKLVEKHSQFLRFETDGPDLRISKLGTAFFIDEKGEKRIFKATISNSIMKTLKIYGAVKLDIGWDYSALTIKLGDTLCL